MNWRKRYPGLPQESLFRNVEIDPEEIERRQRAEREEFKRSEHRSIARDVFCAYLTGTNSTNRMIPETKVVVAKARAILTEFLKDPE